MIQKILNVFRIPELRTKLLFTLALLCVYRIGFYVPVPGVNAAKMYNTGGATEGALGALSNYLSTFSGGSMGTSTIFGLGIMPYITASIIIQLLSTVVPSLEKLKKEGEPGIRKINEWTRYLTVGVCFIQAWMLMGQIATSSQGFLYPSVYSFYGSFWVMSILTLTAGSLFLMWLGEQIDHYGIGNGVSLIITAGIIARMPDAVIKLANHTSINIGSSGDKVGPGHIIFLVGCFIFVVAAAIFLTQAQRRIQIQQAKHMRGRRVYGGQKQYLPLRVNHAGVMPIIFASSLMLFPVMLFTYLDVHADHKNGMAWYNDTVGFLHMHFNNGTYLYELFFCAMIFFFSYFWNTVQFNPKEMSTQLRDYGSFVPGIRPGKRTADYLESIMMRITYVGAAFLCMIAIIPSVAANYLLYGIGANDAWQISQFLGGTGLLIVISVMLDLVNRIEANLVMRNYSGFMDDDNSSSYGAKFRRPKGGASRSPTHPQPANAFTNPKGHPA